MVRPVQYAVLVAGVCLIVALVYTPLAGLPASSREFATSSPALQLSGHTVRVMIADTPEKRAQGLGRREALAPDEGMLFIFPEDGIYAFWMEDMKFPIDIIWISMSDTVVHIAENVSPDTYPRTFEPRTPARYVLELPAGYVEEYDVRLGDVVGF